MTTLDAPSGTPSGRADAPVTTAVTPETLDLREVGAPAPVEGPGAIDVHVHRGPDLPDHLRWQAVSAMRATWPGLFDGAGRLSGHPFPPAPETRHVCVTERDVLLGFGSIMTFPVDHLGRSWRVAALGNVLVQAPYRGEGHGGTVVRRLGEELDGGDWDLALLLCEPRLAPFYQRADFVPLPQGAVLPDGTADPDLLMARWLSPRAHSVAWRFAREPVAVPHPW